MRKNVALFFAYFFPTYKKRARNKKKIELYNDFIG